MASPFEESAGPRYGSFGRREQEFNSRRQSRTVVRENRVNTHWQKERDILWQHNPDRILKYRPSHLHYYGWIPFAILRNWKATVFSDVYLILQTCALLIWVAAIHWTGMGVRDRDLATLVTMFGTPYIGGIFNCGMLVIFILGLFITLVVNRWSSIRGAYTKLMATTTELSLLVANSVKNPASSKIRRADRARTEITRLLNLGHLLVIAKADAQNAEFKKSYGLRRVYRSVKETLSHRFAPPLLGGRRSSKVDSPTYTRSLYKPRHLLNFDTMVSEGLMNKDEWEILNDAENEGMPAFEMVYFWTRAFLNKCQSADGVAVGPQMLPIMLNKVNAIVESGSAIINTINSQMPYPYVHLVSLVVHVYLIVLATWFGSFLHTGRAGEMFRIPAGTSSKAADDIQSSPWMIFWCYLLMAVANVTYQGLLDMHTLLDNPFGNHCAKFALRANVGGVMNASRAVLVMSDKLPAAFGDIFPHIRGDGRELLRSMTASVQSQSRAEYTDFMKPGSPAQFPLGSRGSSRLTDRDRSSQAATRTGARQQGEASNAGGVQSRRGQTSDIATEKGSVLVVCAGGPPKATVL